MVEIMKILFHVSLDDGKTYLPHNDQSFDINVVPRIGDVIRFENSMNKFILKEVQIVAANNPVYDAIVYCVIVNE